MIFFYVTYFIFKYFMANILHKNQFLYMHLLFFYVQIKEENGLNAASIINNYIVCLKK